MAFVSLPINGLIKEERLLECLCDSLFPKFTVRMQVFKVNANTKVDGYTFITVHIVVNLDSSVLKSLPLWHVYC